MIANRRNIFVKIGMLALLCLFAVGMAACGNAVMPLVTDVTLTVESGSTRGLTETEHVLGYSVSLGTESVTVQKDGASAAAADYTYDKSNKTIVFHSAGTYTVTVTATEGKLTDAASVTVTVVSEIAQVADYPAIELTAGSEHAQSATVQEGATLTVTSAVQYGSDAKKTEAFEVYRFNGENFVSVAESAGTMYTWVGDGYTSFRPLIAGQYQIKMLVESEGGKTAERSLPVTVTAAPLKLSLADDATTNGWVRVATGSATDIPYTVAYETSSDAVRMENYDVVIMNGTTAVAVTPDADTKISVTSAECDTATYTITYTHKYDVSAVTELEIPVSFVSDVTNAPVLGEDPFAGTYNQLIPSTGLMLYYDAKADGNKIASDNVTFEIVDTSLTLSDGSVFGSVSVGYLRNNKDYPFLLVENYENNTATGTVKVKMTVTSGTATAAATKEFVVDPLEQDKPSGKDDGNVKGLNAYADHIFDRKDMNLDKIISFGNRQNMVISKEGLVVNRAWGSGNIAVAEPNGADNFQIDFTYTVLWRTDNDKNKASFAVNCRTGKWEGWCDSQMAFYAENDNTQIKAGYWGDKITQVTGTHPAATIGKTYHIRLTHTKEGDTVHFVWKWSEDGETYTDWMKFDVNASTNDGEIGAPVYALQFMHEDGSYCLGGVKLTVLD